MSKFRLKTATITVQYETDADMVKAIAQALIGLAGLITSCNISADLIF